MKKMILSFLYCALLVACAPSPSSEMSVASVKQYVSEKSNTDVQIFVESQKDMDGDFNNLQRVLKLAFMLPENSAIAEVTLQNGLVLKRGIRSRVVTALVVHTKDAQSWKTSKIELQD